MQNCLCRFCHIRRYLVACENYNIGLDLLRRCREQRVCSRCRGEQSLRGSVSGEDNAAGRDAQRSEAVAGPSVRGPRDGHHIYITNNRCQRGCAGWCSGREGFSATRRLYRYLNHIPFLTTSTTNNNGNSNTNISTDNVSKLDFIDHFSGAG